MKLTRRTVFASFAAVAGVASTGFSPSRAMDPVSARMEDDCMWEAAARNGSLQIIAEGAAVSPSIRATPMREDPTLRSLVGAAVSDRRLLVAETDALGRPVIWTITLKGRLYACEKTLMDDHAQVHTLRQMAARGGWGFRHRPVNTRVRKLFLSPGDPGESFWSREPFVHDEFAGAVQAGLVYPVRAVKAPYGDRVLFRASEAARDVVRAEPVFRPAGLHRIRDAAYGYTPKAPV